jgi:hypothetical protein
MPTTNVRLDKIIAFIRARSPRRVTIQIAVGAIACLGVMLALYINLSTKREEFRFEVAKLIAQGVAIAGLGSWFEKMYRKREVIDDESAALTRKLDDAQEQLVATLVDASDRIKQAHPSPFGSVMAESSVWKTRSLKDAGRLADSSATSIIDLLWALERARGAKGAHEQFLPQIAAAVDALGGKMPTA